MIPSGLLYFGLIAAFVGAVSILVPLAFLGIRRRVTGLALVAVGAAVVMVAMILPARETWIATRETRLDDFMPRYQFSEFHRARIEAPRDRAYPVGFRALRGPGFALATMNFRIEDAGPGACTVTTETRVYATDAPTRRRFAGYWRVIYPGSALIRGMWLGAIKRRAESADRA